MSFLLVCNCLPFFVKMVEAILWDKLSMATKLEGTITPHKDMAQTGKVKTTTTTTKKTLFSIQLVQSCHNF